MKFWKFLGRGRCTPL